MGLDIEQIKKALQEKRKKAVTNSAIRHQNRIKFHAQTRMTPDMSQPATEFLHWVKSLLPRDKFFLFQSLFRYPLKTNEVTGIIFDKLSRVFDGRNPAFNYQFLNSEQRDDWEYYRQDVLKEPIVWQTKGWEYFKTEINSVLVVDLPVDQDPTDIYPRPYFYFLTIENILNFETVDSVRFDWLIFKQPNDTLAVIDDEKYRVFSYKNGELTTEPLVETEHDLGYCPARFFWEEPLSLKEPEVKAHPLSNKLDSLDWFLFFHTSKRNVDLRGAYPIYSGYEQQCDYRNADRKEQCEGGFIKDFEGNYQFDGSGQLHRCPACYEKRLAGPGSFIEIPVPNQKDSPDLRNPIQVLDVAAGSLSYNVEELGRLKTELITSTVGVDGDIIQDQAVNDKQVDANFESQSTILNRNKKGFEGAQSFIDETVCRLRYGNLFVSSSVNWGTEFYVANPMELRARYKVAKESGASEAELDSMQIQIIETEYRHNPLQLQRMFILADLEPYRHLSRDEVITLFEKKLITEDQLRIKLNFSNFVRRFERENTNILEFGVNTSYENKINTITNKFKDYANEERARPTS